MKTSLKIFLLAAALLIIGGTIAFFFRAMTAPPNASGDTEDFDKTIASNIELIDEAETLSQLDTIFSTLVCEIKLWNNEGYVSDGDHDDHFSEFFTEYIPAFVYLTKRHLRNDDWGEACKDSICTQLAIIRSSYLKKRHETVLSRLEGEKERLAELDQIFSDYDEAKRLINNIVYTNIDDAKSHIDKASGFCNDRHLLNCDLHDRLSSYADDMGNANYQYVERLYNRLRNWDSHSLNDTKNNYQHFCEAADEYSGTTIYGSNHPKSLGEMKDNAGNFLQQAYDAKCYLMVDGSSSDYELVLGQNASTTTLAVSTDHPDGFQVSGVPSFCRITHDDSSVTISVEANGSGTRQGEFTISSGNHNVKVLVRQMSWEASVSIQSVNPTFDIREYGTIGMRIEVKFRATGLKGKDLNVTMWLNHSNGTPLKDTNNKYTTSNGQVAAASSATPTDLVSDCTASIFIPYDEFHLGGGEYSLKYQIGIFCNGKQYATSNFYNITYKNK